MSRSKQNNIIQFGGGGHDFITSADSVPATRRYSVLMAWGGEAALTYDQVLPGGATKSESVTAAQSDQVFGVLQAVEVSSGTVLAYRAVE